MSSRRQKSKEIQKRLEDSQGVGICAVLGCNEPTRYAAGEGFDQKLCRKHWEYYQRHGSPYRGSYTASDLKEPRRWAEDWLKANQDDQRVQITLGKIQTLLRTAGPVVPAFRLKGSKPAKRAKVAWARLREASVSPEQILHAWISIERMIATDPQAINTAEFKHVQVAKVLHRLASGTHKTWQRERFDGTIVEDKQSFYPRSRGRVLRVMGKQLEEVVHMVEGQLERDKYKQTTR